MNHSIIFITVICLKKCSTLLEKTLYGYLLTPKNDLIDILFTVFLYIFIRKKLKYIYLSTFLKKLFEF
jgi:hypothetical protein